MLLSVVLFLPVLFAVLLIFFKKDKMVRIAAVIFSLIEFLLSLNILRFFDKTSAALQLVEKHSWIPEFGITYFIGIDGISLWLILLTTFLTPLTILGSWNAINDRVKSFHVSIFILETAMLGTFFAMDTVLFYVFWELSLIPMYFIIGIWGGPRRIYATIKFFIYTMLGSVLMLLSIIYMIYETQKVYGFYSASLLDFYQLPIPFIAGEFFSPQTLLFFAFSLAFAIKVPLFPFHTWLPDAHVEAPTPGSVILAGVMLKMGSYGFVRFSIPLFAEAAEHWSWVILVIATIGIIYGAMVAMVQPDIKKLVAYSSVSHMGYILLGLFAFNVEGLAGGIYQMLNHGVSTGALFLLVGMIYERTHSREISQYGGLASILPIYSIIFFIVLLSSIAVPMTNGFVGESLILMGSFFTGEGFVYLAITGVVLGAAYMLWMFKRVFFGKVGQLFDDAHGGNHNLSDLCFREVTVMIPLLILIFWMGLLPNHFLDWSKASFDHLINNKNHYQLSIDKTASVVKEQGI